MKIAIYARVSTDRQAEQGASIDDQIAQQAVVAEVAPKAVGLAL